jgi:DNA polymerase sigma
MTDLNRYIRKFWPNAELTVFGSSGNGFAFRYSDLDISLTFRDKPTAENLNCIEVRPLAANCLAGFVHL